MTNNTQPQIDCEIMEAVGVDIEGALQYIAQANKGAGEYYARKFLRADYIAAYCNQAKAEGALFFYKERCEHFEQCCEKAAIDTALTDDEYDKINGAYWQEYNRLKGLTPCE